MRGAGGRQPLLPFFLRVDGQPAVERGIRDRADACLVQDPQAVLLACRLDDPGQHQLPEDLVPAGGVIEAQDPVSPLDRVDQVTHTRGGDRQRPARGRAVQPEVKLRLPGRHPLTGRRLQRLELGLVVRRADVLDVPRPAPRRPDELHRRCA